MTQNRARNDSGAGLIRKQREKLERADGGFGHLLGLIEARGFFYRVNAPIRNRVDLVNPCFAHVRRVESMSRNATIAFPFRFILNPADAIRCRGGECLFGLCHCVDLHNQMILDSLTGVKYIIPKIKGYPPSTGYGSPF